MVLLTATKRTMTKPSAITTRRSDSTQSLLRFTTVVVMLTSAKKITTRPSATITRRSA